MPVQPLALEQIRETNSRFYTMDAAEIMQRTRDEFARLGPDLQEWLIACGMKLDTPDKFKRYMEWFHAVTVIANASPTFDFGERMDYAPLYSQQAEELIREDAFTLPFMSVYVRSIDPTDGELIHAIMMANADNPHGPPMVIYFTVTQTMRGEYIMLPCAFIRVDLVEGEQAVYSVKGVKYHDVLPYDNSVRYIYWHFCAAVTSLMSAAAKVETLLRDEKRNARRERQGKPRLADKYVVTLRQHPEGPRRSLSENGEDAKRKSPQAHWRRGHIRTYSDGTRIPIEEVFVNGKPGEVPEIGKKMYEVMKEALRAKKKAATRGREAVADGRLQPH